MLIDEVLYPEFFRQKLFQCSTRLPERQGGSEPHDRLIGAYGERLPWVWRRARGCALS